MRKEPHSLSGVVLPKYTHLEMVTLPLWVLNTKLHLPPLLSLVCPLPAAESPFPSPTLQACGGREELNCGAVTTLRTF